MARLQTTQRLTRKGSRKLTDAEIVSRIAVYADPEAKKEIAKFQAARAKMTEEEKVIEVDDVRK